MKWFILTVLAFCFYLVLLPHINSLTHPCLINYDPLGCDARPIFDRFLLLEVVGFFVFGIFSYLLYRTRKIELTVFFTLLFVFVALVIGNYYRYIPMFFNQTQKVNIILE